MRVMRPLFSPLVILMASSRAVFNPSNNLLIITFLSVATSFKVLLLFHAKTTLMGDIAFYKRALTDKSVKALISTFCISFRIKHAVPP